MVISIGQPAYLPWLGYFHRIALSDVHVVLDHVQFERNSFANRNKVRSKAGPILLTVPVATGRQGRDTAICDLATSSTTATGAASISRPSGATTCARRSCKSTRVSLRARSVIAATAELSMCSRHDGLLA